MSGCDQQATIEGWAPDEAAFAKELVSEVAASHFEQAAGRLDVSLRNERLNGQLKEVAVLFPPGPPTSVKVIGANTFKTTQFSQYNLVLEYAYPDRWLLTNVLLQREGGKLVALGLHVNPLPEPLEKTNRFTLKSKGLVHYVFLLLAAGIPLFVMATLVVCVRTRIARRKWIWLVFVALGLTNWSLNWTTGQVGVNAISFSLLGGGFHKAGEAAPLFLSFGLPLGAIIFLLMKRSLRTQEQDALAKKKVGEEDVRGSSTI